MATYEQCLRQVRQFCFALPEVSERISHGHPAFFVREKRTIVTMHDGLHDDARPALWCAAPDGVQAELIDAEPDRFFRPPYVGHRGWLGVRLDVELDWDELEEIIRDAYRCVAPKTLARQID